MSDWAADAAAAAAAVDRMAFSYDFGLYIYCGKWLVAAAEFSFSISLYRVAYGRDDHSPTQPKPAEQIRTVLQTNVEQNVYVVLHTNTQTHTQLSIENGSFKFFFRVYVVYLHFSFRQAMEEKCGQ